MISQQDSNATCHTFAVLGIGEDEERAYRWLLEHSGATTVELARAFTLSLRKARRLLDAIEAKGLATHAPERPCRYIAAAPDTAMTALVLEHQKALQCAQTEIQALRERTAARRRSERGQIIELLTSRENLRQAYEQMHLVARHEAVAMTRLPMLVSQLGESPDKDHFFKERCEAGACAFAALWMSIFYPCGMPSLTCAATLPPVKKCGSRVTPYSK